MTMSSLRRVRQMALAAACAAPLLILPVNASFVGRVLGDRYYEDVKGKFIDVAVAKSQEVLDEVKKEGRRGFVAGSVSGTLEYDAIPLPAVEARATKIMNKLMEQWPGEKPAGLKIVVTANPFFGAESSSSKTITISQSVLRNIESDDELAAIIGHELAHVLLNHFARGEAYEREAKFIADASSVAMMGVLIAGSRVEKRGNQIAVGVKDGKDTAEDMLKAMMVGFAIETISALFNSDWAREQEDEADLLGVDLMAKAGYDVEAATRVLDRLRQTRESAKVDLDKFADMYGEVLAKAAAQGGLDGLKKGLLVVVADAAIRGAKDLLADITKSHADPKRRWEDVGNYIAREYQDPFDESVSQANRKSYATLVADKNVAAVLDNHDAATLALRALQAENPDISSASAKSRQAIGKPTDRAPYALRSYGKVQMTTGNGAEAVRALAIAAADPGASFQTVTLYASALGQMGKFPEAHAALDRASSKFGSAEAIYPARIEMYRLQGDTEKMTATANECFKVENKEIRSSCQASQGQEKGKKKSACTGNESGFEKLFCGVTDL